MPSEWERVEGHIATPNGFQAAAVAAGIKKDAGALDLGLIFSERPNTVGAGVFTSNVVAAAPVVLSRHHLEAGRGRARAIIANAGNANACTGKEGAKTARDTTLCAAKLLGVTPEEILLASTGVIGVPLKGEAIMGQLPALKDLLGKADAAEVARAIMTTDTHPKTCVVQSQADGRPVHIAGIAKGSGMIHPRMATMLCFLTTDVVLNGRMLQHTLQAAVDQSFNRITVDGDTSTNDSVMILANGASGFAVRPGNDSRGWFLAGLQEVCGTLARMIAKDGEGAKKLVRVEVRGARTPGDADNAARAIANSPLVKTAIAGCDPNWGRIICAAGYSGAKFDPSRVDIQLNRLFLCKKGLDAGFDEASAKELMTRDEIVIEVDLHLGEFSATIWTCDLTHDYVTINASYRT
jgi:glutamate N-acetyltransferase / amino-acid N-acetyltransferase